jgi:UDP-3-O-[3-hydroxymyristoyl] N-acetylglucosamine deacetylase
MFLQKTIKNEVVVTGIGLHTGKACCLRMKPAPVDFGIHLIKNIDGKMHSVKAFAENVRATQNATTIGGDHFQVSTVEHCLSSLAALRVDNLFVEIEGPEVPVCDGSARDFLKAIETVGLVEQDQPRRYIYIQEPISIIDGDKVASVLPYDGLRITYSIDFAHPKIGKQTLDIDINEVSFEREIAGARTFGFLKDVEKLRAQGLALGGSYQNAIVLDNENILNEEGLRYPDEFVRHKVLDALGDVVTLGAPLMGHVVLHKAGHDLLNRLARKILSLPDQIAPLELGDNQHLYVSDTQFLPWTMF